ncbi:MAG TPA: ABC transporter ATP-binding protein [Sphingobacteriaceae bacterium]
MNELIISNLSKTYPNGVQALSGISMEVRNGMFGLLGPNGAGKSSLMRTLAGLQKPDAGSVYFNGADILKDPSAIRRHLGYLPQEFGVYPKISAIRLLDHLAVLKGVLNKKERSEQIMALLDQTNLLPYRHKAVGTFSGGMRQRFGIAQALLGSPRIVIVDEPTAGLDPEERNRFNNFLSEISSEVIVVLSTHIVEDVRDLCSRMAVIAGGRILAQGAPESFIEGLSGQVWSKTIEKDQLPWYREGMQVISSRLNAGRVLIHVHSAGAPGAGFEQVPPGLEDVYFKTLLDDQVTVTSVC